MVALARHRRICKAGRGFIADILGYSFQLQKNEFENLEKSLPKLFQAALDRTYTQTCLILLQCCAPLFSIRSSISLFSLVSRAYDGTGGFESHQNRYLLVLFFASTSNLL